MKYLMLHTVDESTLPETEDGGVGEELTAWVDEMSARGVLLDGARLRPIADATTVRAPSGSPLVTDGPFAETKEQVAGYDVIDCPDLDSAVAVAASHPTTGLGAIEVRAFDDGMPRPRGAGPGGGGQAPLPDARLRRHAPGDGARGRSGHLGAGGRRRVRRR
jgi:hypothetical protein